MLPDVLDRSWYGGTVRTWLIAVAIAAGVSALLLLARRFVAARLAKSAERTQTPLDDLVVELVRRTRGYVIVALSVAASAHLLRMSPAVERWVDRAAKVVLLLQVGIWGSALIAFWVRRYVDQRGGGQEAASRATAYALSFFGRILLWAFVVVMVLEAMGYEARALVTGLGIGGVAVALAAQNVLGDLFAALAIYLDKPFVVGDAITVDSYQGKVEHIGLKTTRIRSQSGEQIVFSNSELLKRVVRNYRRLYERRGFFVFAVALETPAEQLARIPTTVRECVERHGTLVRFGRSHLSAITDTGARFETEYFVLDPAYDRFLDTQQAIYLDLLTRFRADGIRMTAV